MIASISDEGVRCGADLVYERWGRCVSGEADALVNGHCNRRSAEDVRISSSNLAQAVRDALVSLGDAEVGLREPTAGQRPKRLGEAE